MTAYVLFIRESMSEPDAMPAYREQAALAREGRTMSTFVRATPETWEGDPAEVLLILEFPTMEEARGWYDSEEYKKARAIRASAAKFRVMAFEAP